MMSIRERNARANAYSYRCLRRRQQKASAAVQRALLSSLFLFTVALAAYIITK